MKFVIGQRVRCIWQVSPRGYDYGTLFGKGATVSNNNSAYLYVVWDKPCGRPDGGYDIGAFEVEGGPW